LPSYNAGQYKIKVVSQYDPSIFYDTIYNYSPFNNAADNLMSIPLNNKILNSRELQPLLDSLKYNMVYINGGTFSMGTSAGNNDERPIHQVALSSFYISKFEVTQHQWKSIMTDNPSFNKGCSNCPVENISWDDANRFISTLNALTNERYRLPTEAEWEFAAKGGALSLNYTYSGHRRLAKIGWYYENSLRRSHPVGQKVSNELGIVDMSGNVAEWCADWYGKNYYGLSGPENPKGPANGNEKVFRGGSWDDYEEYCKIIKRNRNNTTFKSRAIGFRLAKDGR
jgi:formylglycine-generating enzyme required for sulfatase activity